MGTRKIQTTSNRRRLISVAIVVLVTGAVAKADIIYTSEASWLSAVSGSVTTDNFSGVTLPAAPNNDVIYGNGPGATTTLNSVTYTAGPTTNANDYLGILGVGLGGLTFTEPVMAVGGIPAGPADLLITFPDTVNALGFFYDIDSSSSDTITVSDGTVSNATAGAGYPNLAFFGVTSTVGLTSAEITVPGHGNEQAVFVSEVLYGPQAAAATPEPGTLALLVLALLGAGALLRRRQAA